MDGGRRRSSSSVCRSSSHSGYLLSSLIEAIIEILAKSSSSTVQVKGKGSRTDWERAVRV